MKKLFALCNLMILLVALAFSSARGEDIVIELRFENHRFVPQTVTVPADQPVTIKVTNASKETIEFESLAQSRKSRRPRRNDHYTAAWFTPGELRLL